MSRESELGRLTLRLGTEFKAIRALTGLLANLTTADKTSLVAAINEIAAAANAASGINDAAPSSSTTYSSSKIEAVVAALVDAAPGTLDTLNELAAALGDDPNFAATLAAQIGALGSRIDGVYTDYGSPTADLVAQFEAALA